MITVEKLIEHLKTLPMDAICIVANENTLEQDGDRLMQFPYHYKKGSKKTLQTFDAFVGTSYEYERYFTFGGKISLVKF